MSQQDPDQIAFLQGTWCVLLQEIAITMALSSLTPGSRTLPGSGAALITLEA